MRNGAVCESQPDEKCSSITGFSLYVVKPYGVTLRRAISAWRNPRPWCQKVVRSDTLPCTGIVLRWFQLYCFARNLFKTEPNHHIDRCQIFCIPPRMVRASGGTLRFAIQHNFDHYKPSVPIQHVQTLSCGNARLYGQDIIHLNLFTCVKNIGYTDGRHNSTLYRINRRIKLTFATTVPCLSRHKQRLPSYDFNIIWPPDATDSSLILTTKQNIISLQQSIVNPINLWECALLSRSCENYAICDMM